MELTSEQIIGASKLSFKNYPKILNSEFCGCYYCLKIYNPKLITEITGVDSTVVCVYCGIDSVLGANDVSFELNLNSLRQLQEYWFSATISNR